MGKDSKQPEPEQQAGAPEWMVTFSDCMTLLLTFFVLLLSFSSFDDQDYFHKMNSSFANQFSFGNQGGSEKDSFTTSPIPSKDLAWGSEKPTLAEGDENHFKKQTEPLDFLRLNTFLIPSDEIFWGKGKVISLHGKKVLTDLSSFMKEFPNYFVIVSETGPVENSADNQFERAWAVFDYLTTEKGLGKQQLCISKAGTAVKEYHSNNLQKGPEASQERMLEIVLMKRSI